MAGRAQLRRGPQSESDGLTAPKRLSIFPEESAAWSRDSSFTQQIPVVSKKKAIYIVVVAVVIVTIHHQVLNRRFMRPVRGPQTKGTKRLIAHGRFGRNARG